MLGILEGREGHGRIPVLLFVFILVDLVKGEINQAVMTVPVTSGKRGVVMRDAFEVLVLMQHMLVYGMGHDMIHIMDKIDHRRGNYATEVDDDHHACKNLFPYPAA